MKNLKQTITEKGYFILAILLAAGFIVSFSVVWRDIWFDEAMTLLFYASGDSLAEIYNDYSMANNHIGYSMLLSLWHRLFPEEVFLWRFSSILPALLALLILFRKHWQEAGGKKEWMLVLLCFSLSPCYAIYSTALRGYMWSFLAILLVYENCRDFLARSTGGWKYFCFFALSCLWAFLLLPTNIYCAGAALAFAAPDRWWKLRRFWFAAVLIPVAFTVIYLPLLDQMLKVAFSGETWDNRWLAGGTAVMGFVLTMLPVLIFFPFEKVKKSGMNFLNWGVLWCIPAVIICSKYPPFPRNFFPLWPLLLIFTGRGISMRMKNLTPETRNRVCSIMLLTILFWGGCVRCFPGVFSSLCGGPRFNSASGQDDWFAPYYMDENFSIKETAEYITANHPDSLVYVTFDADGFPFLLYGEPAANYLLWNTDRRNLPYGSLIVTAKDEPESILRDIMAGFNLVKNPVLIHETGFHNIYTVK